MVARAWVLLLCASACGGTGLPTGFGVNVNDPAKLVDLKATGIVDPARVTKEALLNAVSIAGTSITMGALVVEVPEKKEAAGAPDMGGMMGM